MCQKFYLKKKAKGVNNYIYYNSKMFDNSYLRFFCKTLKSKVHIFFIWSLMIYAGFSKSASVV